MESIATRPSTPPARPRRHSKQATPFASPRAATEVPPVVVGVDGSERSRDALALATRLVEPGQRLLVAHVRAFGATDARDLIRDVADATFDALRDLVDPAVMREMRLVDNRSPSAGLHDLATSAGAALIVVGSSRRTRLGWMTGGSRVAESVLLRAPAPVAIAPHGYAETDHELRMMGCGVDGSPPSLTALAWAVHLARRRGAALRVLAVHPPIAFGGISTTGTFGYESATATARRDLDEQTRAASAAHGFEVDRHLLEGDPAGTLTAASAEMDLLVFGSRGRGRIRGVLFGSVARELVRSAVCPVVMVPNTATRPARD
jgi:nucleotide-binding universal stress UspA family protein